LIPGRGRDFSLLCSIQTSYEAHPASCLINTRVIFLGIKHKNDNSPSTSAKVKNVQSYTATPQGSCPPMSFGKKSKWKGGKKYTK
jgi:hypothetical protein